MKLSLIAALSSNQVIGNNQQLPWHLSADLKKFKAITMGHPILMGRYTFESIGRPLPGRQNLIVSRSLQADIEGCIVFNDLEAALIYCRKYPELFVIGGASLYESLLPQADYLYLTLIHRQFQGDTFFPKIDWQMWIEAERQDINNDMDVDFSYSFVKYRRGTLQT